MNVSPTQLLDLGLPNQIRDAADTSGFPLNRLTIEITESALAQDLERARTIARSLKEMGCRPALDDFETGYSSLRHLQALPFDALKVDKSFVQSMTETRESRKIVTAIIGLGHSLGLITVGEGVETEKQADMLLCLGCEMAQGWLYGRAVPADPISDIVAAAPTKFACPPMSPQRRWRNSLQLRPRSPSCAAFSTVAGHLRWRSRGFVFPHSLRYVSINRRLADIESPSVAYHLRRTVKEIISEIYPSVEPYLLRALQGESIKEVEVSWPASEHSEPMRTDLISYQPAFDEAREVIGVSVVVVDITEHKRTEEALRESEDHLRHIVELNPETPWVMDADGSNLDLSSRWVQKAGLTNEQARKLGWMPFIRRISCPQ